MLAIRFMSGQKPQKYQVKKNEIKIKHSVHNFHFNFCFVGAFGLFFEFSEFEQQRRY